MTAFPLTHQERHIAIADGPDIQVAFQRAQERIAILEEENDALRQEIRWIDKLLAVPASILSPARK